MQKTFACLIALALMCALVPSYADDLDTSLETLGTNLATQLSKKGVRKVAVDGFTNLSGYKSALGDFIAEELTTTLIANGGINVVERRELDRVLQELSSYRDGTFDSATTAELQKLLGIDALITGSIANLGNRIKINARGIAVETGQSLAAGSVSLVKDETVSYLLDQAYSSASDIEGPNPQHPDAFFKNEFIHVVVEAVAISNDKKKLKVVTELRNISGRDILLAWDPYISQAVSNRADTFSNAHLTGLRVIGTSTSNRARTERYTSIAAGTSIPVSWEYELRRGEPMIKGSKFSVNIQLVQWLSSGPKSYSVGLRNLRP